MSEKMNPLSVEKLLERITAEYKAFGTIFSVSSAFSSKGKSLKIFNEKIETPLGPAAGPNTQLSQNIIAAYFAGARFFELKTVQILDGEDLAKCINRPCIKADDEGYNCEWSTELTVQEAFEEYVKAWCILKVISKAYGLGSPDGFVFNMSVGYDLDGIKSEKIDRFIEGLKDASKTEIFRESLAALKKFFPDREEDIDAISPRICTSVTLSTLHGCPPDEIERIATYLIRVKKLNTFIKCNPTILGYEKARAILDEMGFDYVAFDDHHFKEDLQYHDAISMFRRLQALAKENDLSFGVKLSNTFPVDVKAGELPGDEMYMSGRSLFSLTIEMARLFGEEFDGALPISYSGGADAFHIKELFLAGIRPITVATTILKPGGYMRLVQLATLLCECDFDEKKKVDAKKIAELQEKCKKDRHFQKPIKPQKPRKNDEEVPLFDCYFAPCTGGCPIHQDIPEYLRLVEKGKYRDALAVITAKNPLPFITGTICSHRCMSRCTRNFYDDPVKIRGAKLVAAERGYDEYMKTLSPPAQKTGKKAAVIGAGPAGLSAAYFLEKAGIDTTVFERDEKAGGIVRNVIPAFRIGEDAIEKDIALIKATGADIRLSTPAPSLERLKRDGYDFVIFAVGAYRERDPKISGNVINVIDFLRDVKAKKPLHLGEAVAVIGGGNTAMDAARAVKRETGVKKVSIVYRRTKKYMPADEEELKEALFDGVEFVELAAPKRQENGKLRCEVMRLGDPDESGRRSPVPTGEKIDVDADTVIAAIGELVEIDVFTENGVIPDERGRVALKTNLAGVYNIGDSFRGPCTVVECIADAKKVSDEIIAAIKGKDEVKRLSAVDFSLEAFSTPDAVKMRKGILLEDTSEAYTGCLGCNTVCENCVDVCPNRANTVIVLPDRRREILHIDRLCNECGNCKSFCPYKSAPYLNKLTLFKDEEGFSSSSNKGFLFLDNNKVKLRLNGEKIVDLNAKNDLDKDLEILLLSLKKDYTYLI